MKTVKRIYSNISCHRCSVKKKTYKSSITCFLSNKNKMNYVVVTPYNTVGYVRIPNGRGHNDTR